MSPAPAEIFTADAVLVDADTYLDGGGLLVRGGCVTRVLKGARAVARARSGCGGRVHELRGGCLVPGWVNAHAHLELSGLAGRLPAVEREASGDFAAWVGALLRQRPDPDSAAPIAPSRTAKSGATGGAVGHAVAAGAERCLATGTTTVGDIDALGHGGRAIARRGPRLRLYRELLDGRDEQRTAAAVARIARALPRRARIHEGVSPHAPFTVTDELLRAIAVLRRRRDVPLVMHWAESVDEEDWSSGRAGALRDLVGGPPPERSLERLDVAGLLDARTAVVHGNHARRTDRDLLAARGATLVHCPGSHAFFGRQPFPMARWLEAGVAVALGTDSLASNTDLDMRREMALLRRACPGLAPRDVLRMATVNGARALGFEGRGGTLAPGAWADFAHHEAPVAGHSALLEQLTTGATRVLGTWVAGRRTTGFPGREKGESSGAPCASL